LTRVAFTLIIEVGRNRRRSYKSLRRRSTLALKTFFGKAESHSAINLIEEESMHIPFFIALAAITLWAFFNPIYASYAYIGTIALIESCFLVMGITGSKANLDDAPSFATFTVAEKQVFKKYYLYFIYPFASRSFSGLMSAIQLSSFIWVPWMLYNRQWAQAIVLGINYFVAIEFSGRLNPGYFLKEAAEKSGAAKVITELTIFNSICEKLQRRA
jgi:hypothetical protein